MDGRYVCEPPDAQGRVRVGFAVAGYDRTRRLVIDPVFAVDAVHSSLHGGALNDSLVACLPGTGAERGFVLVASTPAPFTPGASPLGMEDLLVAEYGDDGSLVRQAVVGSALRDLPFHAAPGPNGSILISGTTDSSGFPHSPGSNHVTSASPRYGFVTQLGPMLDFEGGAVAGYGSSVTFWNAAVGAGGVVVSGTTTFDIPTTPGAAITARPPNGFNTPFVMSFSPDFTQVEAATWLGFNQASVVAGPVVLTDGTILVGGATTHLDAPTVGATQSVGGGGTDGFYARFSAGLSALLDSGYLGGAGYDFVMAVAADPTDPQAYFCGVAGSSQGFEATNPFQLTFPGMNDQFVARFDPAAEMNRRVQLVSIDGAERNEIAVGLRIVDGRIYVGGYTDSFDTFPLLLRPAGLSQGGGVSDQSIVILDASAAPPGNVLSSFNFGGTGADVTSSVEADSDGSVLFGATSQTTDVPSTGGTAAANDNCRVTRLARPCPLPETPRLRAFPKRQGSGGEWQITLTWSQGTTPVTSYVVEEAIVTSEPPVGSTPNFSVIHPDLPDRPGRGGEYLTRFTVGTGGPEKRIYRITAYNDCGQTQSEESQVVLADVRAGKVTATDTGIQLNLSTEQHALYSVRADGHATAVSTGEDANLVEQLLLAAFVLGAHSPGKAPALHSTSLEGYIEFPPGQSAVSIPIDRSLLTGPVKLTFTLTVNGKSKKSSVKLKPPKPPK